MLLSLARPALFALALSSPLFGEGPFRNLSFDEALALSAKDDRVVFIDFYTTWCPPCKQLDKVTWKDEKVVAWLEANTVAIKVDAEEEVELARRFRVEAYPTLIFVDDSGEELGRLVGFKNPADFLSAAPGTRRGEKESDRMRQALSDKPHDFQLRMQLGSALEREGNFEEALAEYLWCFDKGLEYEPAYGGVRLSFLLSDIIGLGQRYPPALEALRKRVGEASERLLSGNGSFQDALDLATICDRLGEHAAILELWDGLAKADNLTEPVRVALFTQVLDLLLQAERYTDIIGKVGDVTADLQVKLDRLKELEENADQFEEFDLMREHFIGSTLLESTKIYQALLGAKDERAPAYAAMVLGIDTSASTYAQLARAATKVKAYETAREFLKLGYSIADKAGDRLLRSAERKLPKQERLPREKK